MGNGYTLLDLTVYGRQETWQGPAMGGRHRGTKCLPHQRASHLTMVTYEPDAPRPRNRRPLSDTPRDRNNTGMSYTLYLMTFALVSSAW